MRIACWIAMARDGSLRESNPYCCSTAKDGYKKTPHWYVYTYTACRVLEYPRTSLGNRFPTLRNRALTFT